MTRLYLCLGRAGDIINILPLLWLDAQSGTRSKLMVAKEFAGLLDGCSYLDPVIFDGDFMELDRAVEQAKTLSDDIRVCQLAGPRNDVLKLAYEKIGLHVGDPQTEAYNKESWRLAGRFNEWRNQPPLVFDQRDQHRETLLKANHFTDKRKKVLIAVDSISSPFKYKDLLVNMLQLKFFRNHEIIDLSKIRADRLYDMLGLLEDNSVKCLVAADTSMLHLAYACKKLPVVALVQDQPTLFFGSAWRPNHIFHCRYGDFPTRAVEMLDAIAKIGKPGNWFNPPSVKPRVIHVWSQYDITPENTCRHERAKMAWEKTSQFVDMVSFPVEIGAVGRDSQTVFKDEYRFPYVKDVIRNACLRADDDDLIVLSRADTIFENVPPANQFPFYCYRRSHDGSWTSPAVDLFGFTKKWWRENQDNCPDLIMGHDPSWHQVLKHLIMLSGGRDITGACWREKGTMVQVKNTAYRGLNAELMKQWMEKNNIQTGKPKISEQVKLTVINDRALFPGGYNPSIIEFEGRLLMAYRFHPNNTLATTLAIAELDSEFNVRKNQRLQLEGNFDDPRLFLFGNKLWMGFVKTKWPDKPECVMVYGQLAEAQGNWHLVSSFQTNYEGNDFTRLQKNWVHFQHQNSFCAIYGSQPEQTVLELGGDKVVAIHKSPAPVWRYGEIRGGCMVPWKGKILRFFHSRTDTDPLPLRWRYYCGCLLMEPEPPFAVIKVNPDPLIIGSEQDDLTQADVQRYFHRKQNVVFPSGAIVKNGEVFLSIGINDAACGIVKFTEADLKL